MAAYRHVQGFSSLKKVRVSIIAEMDTYPNVKGLGLTEPVWGEEKKHAILDLHLDVFDKVEYIRAVEEDS